MMLRSAAVRHVPRALAYHAALPFPENFRGPFGSTRWRDLGRIVAAIIVAAIVLAISRSWIRDAYLAVFLIGVLVGLGELVSRYRDAPEEAIRTMPALLYLALNAAAAVAALGFVEIFRVVPGTTKAEGIKRVLLAGFGAMAFFRTSVFTVRVGDQDVSIGPVAFLQIVLHATDRAVDRVRADARASAVAACMSGVSFTAAQAALPAFCMALMQNVPAEEQQDIGDAVKMLIASDMDEQTKAKNLGLLLMNVVGEKVLLTAIENLAAQIKTVLSVTIEQSAMSLKAGDSTALTAVCRDSAGTPIPARQVVWTSADPSVAAVSADGRVRALTAGATTAISATADTASDRIVVTVTT